MKFTFCKDDKWTTEVTKCIYNNCQSKSRFIYTLRSYIFLVSAELIIISQRSLIYNVIKTDEYALCRQYIVCSEINGSIGTHSLYNVSLNLSRLLSFVFFGIFLTD